MRLLINYFFISSLFFAGYIAPLQAVTLELIKNHVNFLPGNSLIITANMTPTNDDQLLSDIYFGIILPDKSVLTFDGKTFGTIPKPMFTAVPISSTQNYPLYSVAHLPSNLPVGEYTLYLGAVPTGKDPQTTGLAYTTSKFTFQVANDKCQGSNELPPEFADAFVETVDDELLRTDAVLGVDEGGLCQGKVYISKKDVPIYRAWNSTNPGSKYGIWWSFSQAAGKIEDFRKDYEVCYQWSPLDRLSQCTLKAGTKIIVGTGQSAKCDRFKTYPVSDARQIYIAKDPATNDVSSFVDNTDKAHSTTTCKDFVAEFNWKPLP